jgi:hypothetical protein
MTVACLRRRSAWYAHRVGTSFIDYRGRGFWTRDAKIELWLYVLCIEINHADDVPDWLLQVRDEWYIQATAGAVGCVSPSLDQHLGNDNQRVARLLALNDRARRRLMAYSPTIPRGVLNAFGIGGPGAEYPDDVDPAVFLPVADAFTALLRGEITWDSATSPVL